jgi:malic enzyme
VESGLTKAQAYDKFVICTIEGALGNDNNAMKITTHKNTLTRPWINEIVIDGSSLVETMKQFRPHVLLGLSASPNIFTEELITLMGRQMERPIIMPMSNPTSRCECTPAEVGQIMFIYFIYFIFYTNCILFFNILIFTFLRFILHFLCYVYSLVYVFIYNHFKLLIHIIYM